MEDASITLCRPTDQLNILNSRILCHETHALQRTLISQMAHIITIHKNDYVHDIKSEKLNQSHKKS